MVDEFGEYSLSPRKGECSRDWRVVVSVMRSGEVPPGLKCTLYSLGVSHTMTDLMSA